MDKSASIRVAPEPCRSGEIMTQTPDAHGVFYTYYFYHACGEAAIHSEQAPP
jgi:hypothetical protein